jgi:hypothetical protein
LKLLILKYVYLKSIKANAMDPIIIGLLIALPFLYVMLVGGLSFMKGRRRRSVKAANNPTVNPVSSIN